MEKSSLRRDFKYYFEMVGIATDGIGNVTIDNKYVLIQIDPTYTIALTTRAGIPLPTFDEIVYYSDCLSYEHDLPFFPLPIKKNALVLPIEKSRVQIINSSYFENLALAYEALNAIKLGPLGAIQFIGDKFPQEVNLPYTNRYSRVAKELNFYSTAVRQLDPFSEFLHYYRIIERIDRGNGMNWINNNLSKLSNYDFGFLEFVSGSNISKRRKNIFTIYRRRALNRLKELRANLGSRTIPEYFYSDTRCGIAHGGSSVRTYDFGHEIGEISKDVIILKLLSRIAIEEKIKAT